MTNEEIFRVFLDHHNCYGNFYTNLSNRPSLFVETCCPIERAIDTAFNWNNTPEGHDYWSDLEDVWWALVEKFDLKNSINYKEVQEL